MGGGIAQLIRTALPLSPCPHLKPNKGLVKVCMQDNQSNEVTCTYDIDLSP